MGIKTTMQCDWCKTLRVLPSEWATEWVYVSRKLCFCSQECYTKYVQDGIKKSRDKAFKRKGKDG
jgi:hypothetical protein